MPVIGDCESRFRVNVRPTNSGFAQEKYGVFHPLSAMPARRAMERRSRILQDEISKPSSTVPMHG
jgi:hypothetical protein